MTSEPLGTALTVFLVAIGGGTGAMTRFLIDRWITKRVSKGFPWGIFVVNVTGSLILGVIVGFFDGPLVTVLGTGLLGGYTTFSTASIDAFKLVGDKDFSRAFGYAFGMLAACILAATLGLVISSAT